MTNSAQIAVGAWATIKRQHAAKMADDSSYRENYLKVSDRVTREQAKGRARLFRKGGAALEEARRDIPGFAEAEPLMRVKSAIQTALFSAREKAGLSQSELGKRLGIPQPNVSRLESATNLTMKSLSEYLTACGCEIAEIKLKAR